MTVQRMDTDLPRPGWPQGVSLGPVGGSLKVMDFGSGIKRKIVGARAAQGGRTSSSPAVDTALLGPWEWNLDSGRMMAPGPHIFYHNQVLGQVPGRLRARGILQLLHDRPSSSGIFSEL